MLLDRTNPRRFLASFTTSILLLFGLAWSDSIHSFETSTFASADGTSMVGSDQLCGGTVRAGFDVPCRADAWRRPDDAEFAGGAAADAATIAANKCRILIMRHAERPGDSTVADLTAKGYERAEKIVPFILKKYGKPDYIFAAALFRKNNRPQLTVEPLSKATGVPINASIEAIRNDHLADILLHDKKYNHKLIVVSWHHTQIPKLLNELHVPPGPHMREWQMETYNLIFEVNLNGKKPATIREVLEPF